MKAKSSSFHRANASLKSLPFRNKFADAESSPPGGHHSRGERDLDRKNHFRANIYNTSPASSLGQTISCPIKLPGST
jgi:hypothetical protein